MNLPRGTRVRLHSGSDTGTVTAQYLAGRLLLVRWDDGTLSPWSPNDLVILATNEGAHVTSLIDTIETAFIEAAREADSDVVDCGPVVAAIERYVGVFDSRSGTLETIVDAAYTQTRRVWGSDWTAASGDVAERVCAGLRLFGAILIDVEASA